MQLSNTDYEQSLLANILRDNRVIEEFAVTSELFDYQPNVLIFRQILSAIARGARADVREIALMMPDRIAYIAGLPQYENQANTRFYVDQLTECSRLRGIVRMAREIGEMVEEKESSAIFEHIDAEMARISMLQGQTYKPASDYMASLIQSIEDDFRRKGGLSGIPTGFPALDDKTNGWQPGNLIVIGARPGAGKTSIALNMISTCLRNGKTVGLFSAEMSAKSIMRRMISDWASVSFPRIKAGAIGQAELTAIATACKDLSEHRLFINDTPAIQLSSLISETRRMKRKDKIDAVVIDYLSLVTNARKDVPRHEQVAQISQELKRISRELEIPVIVLSQLTREAQGERPKLSQLRDSGAVEQDADMVILLHNMGPIPGSDAMKINFIVEKNRDGSVGDIPMTFVPTFMRFKEVAEKW